MPITEDEFDRILTRAAQPFRLKRGKDVVIVDDDYSEMQTHQHSSEDTLD